MNTNLPDNPRKKAFDYVPDSAFIIHRGSGHYSANKIITQHDIATDGKMSAGKMIDSQGLKELMSIESAPPLTLISDNIIAMSEAAIVFSVPAKKRIFRRVDHNHPLGYRQYLFPMPPHLIYATIKSGFKLGAVAVKSLENINADTLVYHAPSYNTYETSLMCIGSVAVEKTIHPNSIPNWIESFFDSVGTNIKHEFFQVDAASSLSSGKKLLSLKNKTTFPNEWLKPHPLHNMERLLNFISKGAKI